MSWFGRWFGNNPWFGSTQVVPPVPVVAVAPVSMASGLGGGFGFTFDEPLMREVVLAIPNIVAREVLRQEPRQEPELEPENQIDLESIIIENENRHQAELNTLREYIKNQNSKLIKRKKKKSNSSLGDLVLNTAFNTVKKFAITYVAKKVTEKFVGDLDTDEEA